MKFCTLSSHNFAPFNTFFKNINVLYVVGFLGVLFACQDKKQLVDEKDTFAAFSQDPKYGGDYAKTLPYDNPDSCMRRIRADVPSKWWGLACMNLFYHLPSSISDSLNLKYLDAFETAFPHDSVREFSQLLRGRILMDQYRFDTARACLEDCYASSMRGKRLTRAGDAKKYLGRMAVLRGHYPEGIQLMLEAYELYPLSQSYDDSQIQNMMLEIARAYKLSNDFQQYQSWTLKGWQYAAAMQTEARIYAAVELADAYFLNRHFDSAQVMVDTAFAMMKMTNDFYYIPEAYYTQASLQVTAGDCKAALINFKNAKRTNRTPAMPRLASRYEKGMGDGYACYGKWDSAIFFYKKALLTPDTTAQIEVYRQMAQAYKNKGALKEALDAEMTASALNDRIFTTTKDNTIGYFIAKSEANQAMLSKQKEIDNQKLYTLLTTIVAVFLCLLVGFAAYFYRREQKQKLDLASLNATKDKLFAILSHDLMSPVAALKNYTILMDWGAMTQDKFIEALAKLKSNVNHTSNMLENVLHWAVSQMGGITPKIEQTPIAAVIHEQIELVMPIAKDKQIEIEQLIPNDLMIPIDKNHLALIIRNLLQNALKFTNTNGKIVFTAKKLTHHLSPITYHQNTEGRYLIEIKDNGVGMSPEILDKLFKLNENANRKGTQQEAGTGLGLILTKELVELNKGQISVTSEVGKGTTFGLQF